MAGHHYKLASRDGSLRVSESRFTSSLRILPDASTSNTTWRTLELGSNDFGPFWTGRSPGISPIQLPGQLHQTGNSSKRVQFHCHCSAKSETMCKQSVFSVAVPSSIRRHSHLHCLLPIHLIFSPYVEQVGPVAAQLPTSPIWPSIWSKLGLFSWKKPVLKLSTNMSSIASL